MAMRVPRILRDTLVRVCRTPGIPGDACGPRPRVAAGAALALVLGVALPAFAQQPATPAAGAAPVPGVTTTSLPPVVDLGVDTAPVQPPRGSAARPASGAPQGSAARPTREIVVVLGPSTPPRDARVIRATNASRVVGSEAPTFTPARDFDVVVDPHPAAPVHAVLLACPAVPLEARRRLWVRDRLGDGQWRAALVLAHAGPWTNCPRFGSAPPDAVLLGDHTVTVETQPALYQAYSQRQLGSDYERGVVTVIRADMHIVPLIVCVDGQAAVVRATCPAGARVCEYGLQRFGTCGR